MSTRHDHEGKSIVFTKGALDSITKRATKILDNGKEREITDSDIKAIYEKNQYFADKALRVLALAYRYKDDIEEAEVLNEEVSDINDAPLIETPENN